MRAYGRHEDCWVNCQPPSVLRGDLVSTTGGSKRKTIHKHFGDGL